MILDTEYYSDNYINEYININEKIYIDDSILKDFSRSIENYINKNKETYFEINVKKVILLDLQ